VSTFLILLSYYIPVIAPLKILIDEGILNIRRNSMPQSQTMTLDEKLAIGVKAHNYKTAGNYGGI
jgi:hypothetical protein